MVQSFLLELPFCSGNFPIPRKISKQNPRIKNYGLDNGAFHKVKSLIIPENIILIFLPPYSPELNPAEKIWAKFKRDFTNRVFENIDLLSKYVCGLAKDLNKEEVISICSYEYIISAIYWTII